MEQLEQSVRDYLLKNGRGIYHLVLKESNAFYPSFQGIAHSLGLDEPRPIQQLTVSFKGELGKYKFYCRLHGKVPIRLSYKAIDRIVRLGNLSKPLMTG